MNLINVFLPIILILITGFLIRFFFIKETEFWRCLSWLVYYFLLPLLLIRDISQVNLGELVFGNLIITIVFASLIVSILTFLLKSVFKINGKEFSSVFQGSIRYNSYILVGVFKVVLLDKGVAFFGIITVFMIILTNVASIAVLMFYCSSNRKLSVVHLLINTIKNPLIISTIFGFFLNVFSIKTPIIFDNYLDYFADSAAAISLMSVGAGLRANVFVLGKINLIFLSTMMKLLVLPGIVLIIFQFVPADSTTKTAALLYASAPCAANSYILAKQMGGDSELMASIVLTTTVFGILTMLAFVIIAQM